MNILSSRKTFRSTREGGRDGTNEKNARKPEQKLTDQRRWPRQEMREKKRQTTNDRNSNRKLKGAFGKGKRKGRHIRTIRKTTKGGMRGEDAFPGENRSHVQEQGGSKIRDVASCPWGRMLRKQRDLKDSLETLQKKRRDHGRPQRGGT